ncbi:hypothetical protein K491DRAFT_675477 [Lophiostoma macrostomum CBS 122681]|uniref:Uncharacterized protein n=1 Tax=Lophiostoma macrostomum CBS 122681 TaxID=1314788 RepID=A0A6A6TKM1_9PLEO|nr:hypothetical protein K491DRAFT_675477 [Lophiostoma macrostomum CBS 122681]
MIPPYRHRHRQPPHTQYHPGRTSRRARAAPAFHSHDYPTQLYFQQAQLPDPPPSPNPWPVPNAPQPYTFDETIAKLYTAISTLNLHFKPLQDQFAREIAYVRHYTSPTDIDAMWESRLNMRPPASDRRSFRPENENQDPNDNDTTTTNTETDKAQMASMLQSSARALRALSRAEKALQIASHNTSTTISGRRRRLALAGNREGIKRAVPKLQTLGSQCLDLLVQARTKYSQIGPLMKELEFLGRVVHEWRGFADRRGGGEDFGSGIGIGIGGEHGEGIGEGNLLRVPGGTGHVEGLQLQQHATCLEAPYTASRLIPVTTGQGPDDAAFTGKTQSGRCE